MRVCAVAYLPIYLRVLFSPKTFSEWKIKYTIRKPDRKSRDFANTRCVYLPPPIYNNNNNNISV